MKDIPEKDWKYFRSLKENILNRFAKTTLSNINIIIASKESDFKMLEQAQASFALTVRTAYRYAYFHSARDRMARSACTD